MANQKIIHEFENDSSESQIHIMSIFYVKGKLVSFSSDCIMTNLSDNQSIVRFSIEHFIGTIEEECRPLFDN